MSGFLFSSEASSYIAWPSPGPGLPGADKSRAPEPKAGNPKSMAPASLSTSLGGDVLLVFCGLSSCYVVETLKVQKCFGKKLELWDFGKEFVWDQILLRKGKLQKKFQCAS